MHILRLVPKVIFFSSVLLAVIFQNKVQATSRRFPILGGGPNYYIELTCSRTTSLKYFFFGDKVKNTIVLYRINTTMSAPVTWKDVFMGVSNENPPINILPWEDSTRVPIGTLVKVQHVFSGHWNYARLGGTAGGIYVGNNNAGTYTISLTSMSVDCN